MITSNALESLDWPQMNWEAQIGPKHMLRVPAVARHSPQLAIILKLVIIFFKKLEKMAKV